MPPIFRWSRACPAVGVVPAFENQAGIETFGEGAKCPRRIAQQMVFPFQLVYLMFAILESRNNFFLSLLVSMLQRLLLLAVAEARQFRSRIGSGLALSKMFANCAHGVRHLGSA